MSIDSVGGYRQLNGVAGAGGVQRSSNVTGGAEPETTESQAIRDLAEHSGLLEKLVGAAMKSPSGRAEGVALLRDAIASGNYQVPVDTLAQKLIGYARQR